MTSRSPPPAIRPLHEPEARSPYQWAVFHIRLRRFETARSWLMRVSQESPDYQAARFLLGRVLLQLNDPHTSVRIFQALIGHSPETETYRLALCMALLKTGDAEAALQACYDLVRVRPECWKAWNSIADITPDEAARLDALQSSLDILSQLCAIPSPSQSLLRACFEAQLNLRQADRALDFARTRYEQFQDPCLAHDLCDRAAYFGGRFALAFHDKIRSLLTLRPKHVCHGQTDRQRLSEGQAGPAIHRICTLLRQAGLVPVPLAGTLLGLYRDRRLLKTDRDVDIGILGLDTTDTDMVDIVRKAPELLLNRYARPGDRYLPLTVNGTSIDLFRMDPCGKDLVFGFSNQPGDIEWRLSKPASHPAEASGLARLSPADAGIWVRQLYGPGWKVPDPYFSSVVHSPALWNTSPHVRAYYAVHRARMALRQGQVRKARAILDRSPIPVPLSGCECPQLWSEPDADI